MDEARDRIPIKGSPGFYRRGSKVVYFYRDTTGKRRWGSAPNLRAAKIARAKLQTDVDSGEWQLETKKTFSEYADLWGETYTGRTSRGIRQLTLDEYKESLAKHATPFFGQQPLKALLATGDGMKTKFLTRDQLDGLLSHAPDDFGRLLILFAANTGFRISEICGLLWGDVELGPKGCVHVRQRRRGDDVDLPKSRASVRTVPLAPNVVKALAEHKIGTKFSTDTDNVFATRSGSPIKPGNAARQYLKPAAVAAGVPDELARFHVLRHTFASVLLEAESKGHLTIRQAADVCGHSDPSFFLKVYAHARELPDLDFLTDAIGAGAKTKAK